MSNKFARISLFFVLAIAISWVLLNRQILNPEALQTAIENAGAAAPLIFMLIYILSTVLFIPGSVLTLLGGALFGPVLGTFYSLTAATIGAMLAFLIARYLASGWVTKKSAGRMQQIIKGVEDEGWRFVAFTRLVPLFPFNLLNYALGLTRISFGQYSIASYIFMLPGALAYTYLGYIGKEAASGGENLIQKSLLALALLATVAFIPRLINKLRKVEMIDIQSLKSQLDQKQNILLLDVRSDADYRGEQGHIIGSTLLPLEELKQRISDIESFRDKPVITICRTDKRSSQAARLLSNLGFKNVKVARMGMTDWLKHQYPTQK